METNEAQSAITDEMMEFRLNSARAYTYTYHALNTGRSSIEELRALAERTPLRGWVQGMHAAIADYLEDQP